MQQLCSVECRTQTVEEEYDLYCDIMFAHTTLKAAVTKQRLSQGMLGIH